MRYADEMGLSGIQRLFEEHALVRPLAVAVPALFAEIPARAALAEAQMTAFLQFAAKQFAQALGKAAE